MKRHGNLFGKIIDIDNLCLAHQHARRGKSYYTDVRMVDSDPERYLWQLHDALRDHTFTTSQYTTKQIYEPKQRTIYKLPYFPDRIIHHAVMQVIQPIWDRTFIFDLYSAIPGKGLHAGSYRLRQFLRDRKNTKCCLKFDVSKFYPSIDHDILIEKVRKKIKCPDTLWLLEDIIRSPGGNKNVPIGNYLSQYLSNLYLNDFDHWIKETIGMKYYIRYCDDGVIFHQDKTVLRTLMEDVREYMQEELALSLNPKTTVLDVDRQGVDFLGYKCFRDYTLLRKSSARNFKKKIAQIEAGNLDPQNVISSTMSYLGWLKHCDAHHLSTRYIYNNQAVLAEVERAASTLKIENPLRR
ncbi:MAG: reverse transcriptase/maturase family protein [Bacteroidales bacterium]|jgi:retron-type reverse transcriptase|nr:reverse transcriptase/maturase family protein [Bacteroidales bacterium]MDD3399057.1 reverse transcriptase/maturase family protein [Candidatus Methanomethylophilaceae archaeon]